MVPECYTKNKESAENEDAVSSLKSKAFITDFSTLRLILCPVASWITLQYFTCEIPCDIFLNTKQNRYL